MSLYGSLFAGVTGLTAQSRALGTISENITNINTVGFKAKTTHFSTLVAAGNAGSSAGVSGVLHRTAKQIDAQGILQNTENPTDIAITGSGFFVVNSDVKDGNAVGDTMFTRAGHFEINKDSHLANAAGHFLMGWKLDKDGEFVDSANNQIVPDPTSEDDLLPVDLSEVTSTSEGTDNVSVNAAFPASMSVADQFTITSRVFDDLGGTHSVKLDYTKTDHIVLGGDIPRLVDSNEPDDDDTFSLIIDAPASPTDPDDASSSSTKIELIFSYVGEEDGSVTWKITPAIPNELGEVGGITPSSIEFTYNADDELLDNPLQEIEVEWLSGLNRKNTIFAVDLSKLVLVDNQNTDGATDVAVGAENTATLNADSAVMRMSVRTANGNDEVISGQTSLVEFDGDGLLVGPASVPVTFDWSNLDTFAPNTTLNIQLGTPGSGNGLSISGTKFAINSVEQDGIAFGEFSGVTIDDEGFVIANFKNGTFLAVYRIPLADFNNPNGLRSETGNAFQASLESGEFFLNIPGEGGVGSIVPKALEQSTVDIAREFTNMIITQRAFSAASTAITTADEMLQELVNIKR